jgi:hypothetical protein
VNYNGLKIEKYHCPISLERRVIDRLVSELTYVATDAFGKPRPREDVENHVIPVSTLLIAKRKNKAIGFSTSNVYHLGDFALIYGAGTCVLKSEQGNGIYPMLNEERLKAELEKIKADDFYFSVRTQNPIIYSSIKKVERIDKLYPDPETKVPKNILVVAKKTSRILGCEVKDNLVVENAYDSCLYGKIPRCRDEKINNMFDSLLNYERDALLIVAKILK